VATGGYRYRFLVVVSSVLGVMFILVGVVLMGVEGRVGLGDVCRDVLYEVYFRVFHLYTTHLVCII